MTDKAKALGLPTDQEIEEILTPLTPQSKGFYFEQRLFGAKLMRDKAESRIKEVAIEFAVWCHDNYNLLACEKSFDIFLEERSKSKCPKCKNGTGLIYKTGGPGDISSVSEICDLCLGSGTTIPSKNPEKINP